MKKHLQVIAVNAKEFKSNKTGKAGVMHLAQCVVRGDDGLVEVGELMLPESLKATAPGEYEAQFSLWVDFEKRIGARLVSLTPVRAVRAAA